MARATRAVAASLVISSLYPASKTAIAAKLPEPIVQNGRLSVDPWGCTCAQVMTQHPIDEALTELMVTSGTSRASNPGGFLLWLVQVNAVSLCRLPFSRPRGGAYCEEVRPIEIYPSQH